MPRILPGPDEPALGQLVPGRAWAWICAFRGRAEILPSTAKTSGSCVAASVPRPGGIRYYVHAAYAEWSVMHAWNYDERSCQAGAGMERAGDLQPVIAPKAQARPCLRGWPRERKAWTSRTPPPLMELTTSQPFLALRSGRVRRISFKRPGLGVPSSKRELSAVPAARLKSCPSGRPNFA